MNSIFQLASNPSVLVIFFNRPNVLSIQLNSLKNFKPQNLYFASDGIRSLHKNDVDKINECKNLVSQVVDWNCKLHFFYSDINYGCDQFVPMAISWFFEHVESGIILEDDCIISEDFYRFSSYLLKKYEFDTRIMNISASNFQNKKWGNGDYYFSRYPANWAWATWRRAWKHYDSKMTALEEFLNPSGGFAKIKLKREEKHFWKIFFLGLNTNKYSFWDAKWVYAIWKNNGISITPNVNLSSNIGFGKEATHTKKRLKTHALSLGLLDEIIIDPKNQDIEIEADFFLFKRYYKPSLRSLLRAAINRITLLLK